MTSADESVYRGTRLEIPRRQEFVRSPRDVLGLILALIVALIGLGLALAFQDALVGFEEDLLLIINRTPTLIEEFVIGFVQIVALAAPLVVVVVLVASRHAARLFVIAVAAALGALATWGIDHLVVDRARPSAFLDALEFESWVSGSAFPNSPYIAGAVAAVVVAGPWLSRRWRRATWALIWAFVLLRLVAGVNLPVDLVIALGFGWAAGAAVRLLFGAPNRSASGPEIVDALRSAALEPVLVEAASVDARGSTPYFAETTSGSRLFVKVLSPDERSADLLFRAYRSIRLKNVGDERSFSSLRRTVEHEALLALAATANGVTTPRLVTLAAAGEDSFLLAYEMIDGSSLDGVAEEDITDDVLRRIWEQVAMLRTNRTAHRDLRLANVFLDSSGEPWIIDFGFSELAASDRLVNNDVAELVLSSSLKVGAERAVRAAVDVIGTEAVCAAAPRMQPLALSGATRSGLKKTNLLDEVHERVTEICGADAIELEKLERVKPRSIITIGALFLAVYLLIPQLAEVDFATLVDANWGWAALALVFSFITYVGAAASMAGSVPDRLPAWATFEAQVGSSFVNRVMPAKVGGIATNLRFLQKAGVETPVAAAGLGISTIVGVIVHVSMLIVFAAWTGKSAAAAFHLPSVGKISLVLTIVFVVAGAVAAVPWTRRVFVKRLWPMIKKATSGATTVVKSPSRMALVFGGSLIITWSYIFALWVSVLAFGGNVSFAAVGVTFLAGSAVAQAAPTPGGVGAAEAAFIAALTGFGLDASIAVPAVFLYRFATFWLPILPGWLAFTDMERKGAL